MAARLPFAVVTLLTTDSYLPGALTAIHSLLDIEGPAPFRPFETVCLVTPSTVSHDTLQALEKVFDRVVGVEEIVTQSWTELDLLGRKDLAASLTKLHLFRLSQYRKVIFLDADTLVLRPISPLFDTPHTFAAAPDSGWPDAFNSGFLIATPAEETFNALMRMMAQRGSWDGGDQGLLNDFFPDWHRLSFTYNVTPSAYYTYAPAYRRHGSDVSVLHFIGRQKPWNRGTRDTQVQIRAEDSNQTDYYQLVNKWFDVFERHFGTGLTWDVASRVVVPPTFAASPLVSLPAHKSASTPPTRAPPQEEPPVALWDAARSAPPSDSLQMREPINDHYDNMWDHPSTRKQKVRFAAPTSYPAPPPSTHDWYRGVMKSAPDPSAVKAVFPWERKFEEAETPSRRASRSFPPEQPPLNLSGPPSAAPTYLPSLATPSFSNAWDAIPGIGRYATSLAAKTGSSSRDKQSTAAGPQDSMGGRKSSLAEPDKSYDRRSDASSRDGDDEDESETNSSDDNDRLQIKFKSRDTAASYGATGQASPSLTGSGSRSRSVSGGSEGGRGSSSPTFSLTPSPTTSVPTSPTKPRRDVRHLNPVSPRLLRTTSGGPSAAGSSHGLGLSSHEPPHHAHHAHHTHHAHHAHHAPAGAKAPIRINPSVAPGSPSQSPRLAAQALRNSTAARLVSTGTGVGDGPPIIRATRVFSPDTDPGVIKKQGLASLQRFVEHMENSQGNLTGGGAPGSAGTWRY